MERATNNANRMSAHRGLRVMALVALLASAGCAPDAPPGFGQGGDDHFDILIASTADGGGALAADYDFSQPIEVFFNQCLGGSGQTCEGGIQLYSAEDPGIMMLETDESDESFFVLEDDTTVALEIIAADPGASLFLGGVLLDQPGDSVDLPTVPDLHTHGDWQVAAPGGGNVTGPYSLSFKLTTTSLLYSESQSYTALLMPSAAPAEE